MSEHWELAPSSINKDMAEMQRKLRSIGEMERVLTERSARREAYRYLLDAHRILSREAFEETQLVDLHRLSTLRVNQMAA